jgi:NADH-quinone oxidoreductase subunit L
MTTLVWLLPCFPAAGAAINGLFGIRWFSRTATAVIACISMLASLALAIAVAVGVARLPIARTVFLGEWIPPLPAITLKGAAAFHAPWQLLIDPLAAVMVLVVTGVGFLIHLYATAYMRSESRGSYARFFCYLNLFCAFMLLLVLAGNFIVLFVGWEGVGLCSYLLIGFWYQKASAANAGRKAFIVNRIGDWGFLLGIMAVFFAFGTLDFEGVAALAGRWPIEVTHFGGLSIICLLLFIGAAGKSAQIPLYVWLPDAMEGPTPVSALIHAATMVTAGVYVVARNAVLFSHAPLVLAIIAIVGALTAVMAASIAIVQTDIKRVLAYSTISQLGFMFLAAGVGAVSAAIFHLVTHAFFKALLFLASGIVIHAMAGEQDMRRMGGLRRHLPVTFVTMVIGALAIAGAPPLAGFFSKDEILLQTFGRSRALWALAAITSLLTALYMFRLIAMTFYGRQRESSAAPSPHEAPATMTLPLPCAELHGDPRRSDPEASRRAGSAGHPGTIGAGARGARTRSGGASRGVPRHGSDARPGVGADASQHAAGGSGDGRGVAILRDPSGRAPARHGAVEWTARAAAEQVLRRRPVRRDDRARHVRVRA